MEISARAAQQFMKIAREIPNTKTSSHLGSQILYEISTLRDDQKRQQLKRAENDDAPTVRELKRKNREQEQRIKELEN
ncbi:hypothetical protein [Aerococcus vaginalis]